MHNKQNLGKTEKKRKVNQLFHLTDSNLVHTILVYFFLCMCLFVYYNLKYAVYTICMYCSDFS